MAGAYGQRLRLRLFAEGIEIPVISANVRTAPNSPMMASIQIPPLAEGTRFHPRTLIHLFFLDMYEQKSPFVSNGTFLESSRHPTAYERKLDDARINDANSQDPTEEIPEVGPEVAKLQAGPDGKNDRFKLLFVGEMIGFQWTKNQSQRSLVLQCADLSNYWDYAYQHSNTGIFGPGYKAMFSGGSTNLFTDFLDTKGGVITRIVSRGRCNTYPKMKGLAAGFIRLLEGIGGTYQVRNSEGGVKKLAGQNIFFSTAELRLHITQMIGAVESDPTSQRLLNRQGYSGLFGRTLGGLGGQTSYRKALSALSGVIFHEIYPQPCPYYLPGSSGTTSGIARVKLSDHPQLKAVYTTAQNALKAVNEVELVLTVDTEQFPEVRVLADGTRRDTRDRLLKLANTLKRAQYTNGIRQAPQSLKALLSQAATSVSRCAAKLSKWRPDAPSAVLIEVTTPLDEARAQLQRILEVQVSTTRPGQQEPARLMQQILRPDIWFGAPPRCNVLFPEDYDTFTYQRMFLQEPTRFMLKTNDEFFGEDFLFDKFYFAPQAGSLKKEKARLRDMLRGDLLDHEIFTGILPVFEKMGEFNVFAARSGSQKNPTQVSFAQRAANFLYFKHRFNSRQARVAGKFNPYIATGCPGLIIDKYVDQDTIANLNALRENEGLPSLEQLQLLGTHYLGNFTEVSHAVSQADTRGTTEVNIAYPRQVDESMAYLGAVEKVQTVQRRQDTDAVRSTDVAALETPKLGSLGPFGGIITEVHEVTPQYDRTQFGKLPEDPKLLPLYGRERRYKVGQVAPALVPIGVPTSASYLGSVDVLDIVGSDREVTFKAYRVQEEVPRYKREQVDLPAEEFIRPGWYGDIWSSPRIGEAYNQLFGIGSITDPQQIADPTSGSLGNFPESGKSAQDEADAAENIEDPRADAPAVFALDENASIEQAVEFLVLTYSYIRSSGLDIDEFIHAYKWRPIASMVDMLGTSDLKLSPTGAAVQSGLEGFHSRAFGPYNDIFGLVGPDLEDLLGIKRGSTVAQKGDTRGEKYERVQAYMAQLQLSRGILG